MIRTRYLWYQDPHALVVTPQEDVAISGLGVYCPATAGDPLQMKIEVCVDDTPMTDKSVIHTCPAGVDKIWRFEFPEPIEVARGRSFNFVAYFSHDFSHPED